MKYPMLSNCLVFTPLDNGLYEVRDCRDETRVTMSAHVVRFARKLNGKRDPYRIMPQQDRAETNRILALLDSLNMLRYSRILSEGGLHLLTLWFIRPGRRMQLSAKVWNTALNLLWLPLLLTGLWLFWHSPAAGTASFSVAGSLAGLIIGLFLHEVGHMMATLAWGGRVFEIGVMLLYVLPGAYCMSENLTSRKARIQVNAAGIKTNFLLGGLFLTLSAVLPGVSSVLFPAVLHNLFMGFMNLVFFRGLDGASLIENDLGTEGLIYSGLQLLFSRSRRRRLLSAGPTGYAVLAAVLVLQTIQLYIPLLLIASILEVFL